MELFRVFAFKIEMEYDESTPTAEYNRSFQTVAGSLMHIIGPPVDLTWNSNGNMEFFLGVALIPIRKGRESRHLDKYLKLLKKSFGDTLTKTIGNC